MLRFITIFFSILCLYLVFISVKDYDSNIVIEVYDYIVNTSLFFILGAYVASLIIVLSFIKMICLIFDLPINIKRYFEEKKAQKLSNYLLKALTSIIQKNDAKSLEIVKKVSGDVPKQYQDLYNLVLAKGSTEFDQKILYLRNLLDSNELNYFALKELASLFFSKSIYEIAENYALKAYNLEDEDPDVIEILLECSAKLKNWRKVVFLANKLDKVSPKRAKSLASTISNHYVQAAYEFSSVGEIENTEEFLHLSLEADPTNLSALEMITSLNINKNHSGESLNILANAFSLKPSFEVAEMYIKTSNSEPARTFKELSKLVDIKTSAALFLTIASYMGLMEEVLDIKKRYFPENSTPNELT